MKRALSHVLSVVFVPLIIPPLASFLAVWSNPYAFGGWRMGTLFIIQMVIWTLLIPVIGIFLMRKLEFIGDIGMNVRTERIAPYLLIIMCYSIGFYAIHKLPIPGIVKAMVAGSLLSIILSFFWNNFLKVSAHANGMGSLLGACIGIVFISIRNIELIIVGVILLSGMVLSARVYLTRHTNREVFYGYAIGFLTQLLAISLWDVFQL